MKSSIPGRCRRATWLLLLVIVAGACGCGRTAKITGKVTYQGRPVRYGSVIFLSADKTARSSAIGPDGAYAIDDVPAGEVRIGVISRDPSRGRSTGHGRTVMPNRSLPSDSGRSTAHGRRAVRPAEKAADKDEMGVEGWFSLPTRLEDPETSGQTCTAKSGEVSHDIDLQ